MNTSHPPDPQSLPLEEQLVGVNAKTAPYPAARSWSGGRRRLVGKGPLESYCYHAMSRTCGGEVLFDDVEKEALKRVLWRMAEFCGVRLVTYCVMGNHFHALVEVPRRDLWLERFAGPQGETRLLQHLRVLYSKAHVDMLRTELAELRKIGQHAVAQTRLDALKRRFCDLSLYVKEVKERFSRWFNKRRGRRGTLWMDRFKSVLVESSRSGKSASEGEGDALRTMAAYIDLNPVRAGLVKDPKDYRWCGYGEAAAGSRRAQRGLCRAVARPVDGWHTAQAAQAYRRVLFADGTEVKDARKTKIVRPGVTAEAARQVLAEGGTLSTARLVRLRVRYFTDGLVLGSKAFVETVFADNREKFGPKRKDGARRIGESDSPLYSMRRLRLRALE